MVAGEFDTNATGAYARRFSAATRELLHDQREPGRFFILDEQERRRKQNFSIYNLLARPLLGLPKHYTGLVLFTKD